MKRHLRDTYYIVGEGLYQHGKPRGPKDSKEYYQSERGGGHKSAHGPYCEPRPGDIAEMRKFRFSRLGPKGERFDRETLLAAAQAMTAANGPDSDGPKVPAGFTYLGQFIDHDVTFDRTATALGSNVSIDDLIQGRSPALDLDCLYGRGPDDTDDRKFYVDGIRLKMGRTAATPNPPETNIDRDGFDLPREGFGSTKTARRAALIPDPRNDENLVVAQTHLAMIRFHNRVVDTLASQGTPSADLFNQARELVTKHYQWMIKTDFLPRIIDMSILTDVFINGRKFFDKDAPADVMPSMPVEFSVAAYRLGHSMIREQYEWNRVFRTGGTFNVPGTLPLLFRFSGTSGTLSPTGEIDDRESGDFERLPTNWIADFRRLYDFTETGRNDLNPPEGAPNITKKIDTLLVDPLKTLPLGSFGGSGTAPPTEELNLAFRNLLRANMVELASGQQMAQLFGVSALTPAQIISSPNGATLPPNSPLGTKAPLWLYILREAELQGGKLGAVGGRIVAEVFHRAMEGSKHSILRDPTWKPGQRLVVTGAPARPNERFNMTDLLLFAFEGKKELLNPLGD